MKIKLTDKALQAAHTKLPAHMSDSVIGYFEQGFAPGSFLRAILENDLIGAFANADEINRLYVHKYVEWLYWHVLGRPNDIWGSREAVQKHLMECYEENEHPSAEVAI